MAGKYGIREKGHYLLSVLAVFCVFSVVIFVIVEPGVDKV